MHEKYHQTILDNCAKYKDRKEVEGLLFGYTHFYGSFDYVGDSRTWYRKEIRIIKNDKSIRSYKDAQGFRKAGRKLQDKPINAQIYHYGWVRDPRFQQAKQESFNKLHPSYYYGAHACIMVFDATRRITYDNLKVWYTEMRNHCPHIPCIIIANKIDLDPRTTKRSYKFVEELKVPFNFVSAADGTNVV